MLYIIIVQNQAKFKEFTQKMSEKPVFSGIVCEFNPLHYGHLHLLQTARRFSDAVICVMSGNWVQRGEPAILSKFARAKAAVACGADLVAELPLPWACAGAEKFAFGAVSLLESLGCIQSLWFGSECGDVTEITKTAQLLCSQAFSDKISPYLKQGVSFAAARQMAVASICGEKAARLLVSPNNILGIEYCKALYRLQSSMIPKTIQRVGSGHDCDVDYRTERILSASQLRKMIQNGQDLANFLPQDSYTVIQEEMKQGRCPANLLRLERAILAKLRLLDKQQLATLPDISEGLENRLYQSIQKAQTLDELYEMTKSKRYSHARIRRLVMAAFLNIPNEVPHVPPYFRILAMNHTGREFLRTAASSSRISLVSRSKDFAQCSEEAQQLFQLEQQATDLFALSLPIPPACGWDCWQGIQILS